MQSIAGGDEQGQRQELCRSGTLLLKSLLCMWLDREAQKSVIGYSKYCESACKFCKFR